MLKIYGRRNAFNVQKVMWLLEELNLEYQHIPVGGSFGGLNTPEFLAMNPCGHIPVIQDETTIVWESHTILRYLAACYGENSFWSADPGERSLAERWMDWSQTTLQPDFLNGVFWGFYRTPEAQRNSALIQASIQRCTQHFQLLDKILTGQSFLCGNNLSLADVPAGTTLYRYFELGIERPAIPHVEAWYQRLQQRPAYRNHIMVPFDELKGKLSFQ